MSREIKFRAWSKKHKRMVYLAESLMSNIHLQMNNHSWGIFEPDRENYCGGATFNNHFEDILMQYTGLKDKNGKEIYEGDILKLDDTGEEGYEYKEGYDFKNRAVVIWNNGRFELDNFMDDNSGILEEMNGGCHEDFILNFKDSEVIGNIYENPELLESEVE